MAGKPLEINNQMFNMLAKKAQYFYYVKLRLATCMPSKCSQRDLESIGERGKWRRGILFARARAHFVMTA